MCEFNSKGKEQFAKTCRGKSVLHHELKKYKCTREHHRKKQTSDIGEQASMEIDKINL